MKKHILLTLAIFMLGTFSGCTPLKQSTGVDLDAKAYQVSTSDLGNGYIKGIVSNDDYLYILSSDEHQNSLQKVSLYNNEKTNIDLTVLPDNQAVEVMAINSEGNYLLLVSETSEAGVISKLIKLSEAGEIINESNLTQLLGLTENITIQNLSVSKNDMIYLTVFESEFTSGRNASLIYALNSDMDEITKLNTGNYVSGLIVSNENEVYLSLLGESGMELRRADFNSGMTEAIALPIGINHNNIIGFAPGNEDTLLCADGTGLLEVDLLSGSANRVFSWLDGNTSVAGIRCFGRLNDHAYWIIKQTRNREISSAELLTLTETTYRELPPRIYLTCATPFLNNDLLDTIVAFNKTNGKYHLNVKEYLRDVDPLDTEALTAAMIRLHSDITGGNSPDLINLDGVNFRPLAAKGAFYDLTALIEQHRIKQADYLDFAFDAYALDGRIYAVMPGFMLNMLVGHQRLLGDLDSWTIEEMIEWAQKYPDARLLRGDGLAVISLLLDSNCERFINWETGECDFNSPEFINILAFAAASNAAGYDGANSRDEPGSYEGFKTGEYLLLADNLSMLNDFYEHDTIFDGEARYIGYPTASGSGISGVPNGAFAISADSANKDGAFAFIEYLLGEEYQHNGQMPDYSIPVKRSAIETYAKRLLSETPGMGERVPHGYNLDDLYVRVDLARDEKYLELLTDIIFRVDSLKTTDEQLLAIISEETASLFAGQKTAAAVAETIQNRVQGYVNENR